MIEKFLIFKYIYNLTSYHQAGLKSYLPLNIFIFKYIYNLTSYHLICHLTSFLLSYLLPLIGRVIFLDCVKYHSITRGGSAKYIYQGGSAKYPSVSQGGGGLEGVNFVSRDK